MSNFFLSARSLLCTICTLLFEHDCYFRLCILFFSSHFHLSHTCLFQNPVWGETCDQLESQFTEVTRLLTESYHRMGETQGVCQDILAANAAFIGTLTEYVPMWVSSLRNASVVGWSSDPTPVMLARSEFWLVLGGSLGAFLFGCGACLFAGIKIGRSRERPEIFLPYGRYPSDNPFFSF